MKTLLSLLLSLLSVSSITGQNAPAAVALPKVALIGDSIRLSYAPTVIRELKGVAEIVSPKANGGDSGNVLKNLESWAISAKPDVVHFNCGIHDTKKFKSTGRFQVSPDKYEANLRAIVKRIRDQTEAVVIFGTTTPILDDRAAAKRQGRNYDLTGAAIEQYNAIAVRIMRELKVPINDLNAVITKPAKLHTTGQLVGSDGVHMNPPARELLGNQVVEIIRKQLNR